MEDGEDQGALGAPPSRGRRGRRRHTTSGADGAYRPPSPSSTSSSDFEFTVSLSPKSRKGDGARLCPADELFYKGQLLPLHLSPRLSMVRSLLLASSSTSSCSDSATTASRDSSGSSNDSTASAFSCDALPDYCDSSRPSSVTEEEDAAGRPVVVPPRRHPHHKYYFSSLATRFSAVFHRKKESQQQQQDPPETGGSNYHVGVASASGRKSGASGSSAKEVFKKYVKKVKPLYEKLEKLSALQQHRNGQQQKPARQELRKKTFSFSVRRGERSPQLDRAMMSASASRKERKLENEEEDPHGDTYASHSFSGNLTYLRRRQLSASAASCPSSMRSSPSHSCLHYPRERGGGSATSFVDPVSPAALRTGRFRPSSSSSSMEELQSAIQGAIAHCKSTMVAQSNQGKVSTASSEQT